MKKIFSLFFFIVLFASCKQGMNESSVENYAISVTQPENGKITVKNKATNVIIEGIKLKTIAKNTIVNISIEANKDYKVDSLTIDENTQIDTSKDVTVNKDFAVSGVISKRPSMPIEKTKLTSIKVGTYTLTDSEFADAETSSGCVKVFPKDFQATNKITLFKEDDATVYFSPPNSENITLSKNPQTITILVSKIGKLDNTYKLVLSKEEEVTPPQKLPFDDMVEVLPPTEGIIGRTFNPTGLQWDGVFLKNRVVKLSPFSIAKYELTYKIWHTVTEWAKIRGYKFTGLAKEAIKLATPNAKPTTNNLPVTQVNWNDAIIWCNAYTEMQKGEAECVYREESANNAVLKDASDINLYKKVFWDKTKKGYRLLSEAEWEYVARYQKNNDNNVGREYGAGIWLTKIDTVSGASKNWKDTKESAKYCWWTSSTAEQIPKTVDGRTPNHLGVHDMSGNMMEWVYDWYIESEEKVETVENPEGPALTSLNPNNLQKVMKGGAYNSLTLSQCLPAYRNGKRTVLNVGDHMDSGIRLGLYK